MEIPKDPDILVSFLNMKLRDFYADFDDLCRSLGTDKEDILRTMEQAHFRYCREINQWIPS